MTVGRILNTRNGDAPPHIAPDAEVSEVMNSLAFKDVGALVVSSDGCKVDGIVSERGIVRGLQAVGPELFGKKVQDAMTEKVVTCVAENRAAGIMDIMVSRRLRHVPVVKLGMLVNMIRIRDLRQLRLDEVQSEAVAMRSCIAGGA